MATAPTADMPHDAAATLAGLAGLGAHLIGFGTLEVTPVAGSAGEAMLVIEGADLNGAPATWLVTAAPGQPLVLEEVVNETRLDLLAVAPADRILRLLAALAGRVTVHA